jgi:hypothetical protein
MRARCDRAGLGADERKLLRPRGRVEGLVARAPARAPARALLVAGLVAVVVGVVGADVVDRVLRGGDGVQKVVALNTQPLASARGEAPRWRRMNSGKERGLGEKGGHLEAPLPATERARRRALAAKHGELGGLHVPCAV